MNKKVIALIGMSASGKDSIMQSIVADYPDQFHEIISCTTRPKRDYEHEGVEYYFVSGEKFAEMVLANEMLEATCFNDWFYGTPASSLVDDKVNIGVFNPAGIRALLESKDIDLTVYWIQASAKTRLLRQLNREYLPNIDEIFRRYQTDKIDFDDLDFNCMVLPNETENDFDYAVKTIVGQTK